MEKNTSFEAQNPAPSIIYSRISDWAGDPLSVDATFPESAPNEDKAVADSHQITERMFDLLADVYSFPKGRDLPTNDNIHVYRPLRLLMGRVLVPLMAQYAAFAYDSLTVRFSVSDPKAIAGGCMVGHYLSRDWRGLGNDSPGSYESEYNSIFSLNNMSKAWLVNFNNTHFMPYGMSNDVQITIPWAFMSTQVFRDHYFSPSLHDDGSYMNLVGEPILFVRTLASYNVSSVIFPPKLRIFVKFNNLRFLYPNYLEGFRLPESTVSVDEKAKVRKKMRSSTYEPQSGMEPVMLGLAAEAIASAGAEVVDSALSPIREYLAPEEDSGTYERPTAVQLSFAGDTTSMFPPSTSPIFSAVGDSGEPHAIIDFLKQPQLIDVITTHNTTVREYYSRPTNPTGAPRSSSPTCTWFNWFGQCATYWRGTLYFDFIIAGHPTIEVAYNLVLQYPNSRYWNVASGSFSETGTLTGLCKGPTRITVPMPFASTVDKVPIYTINNNVPVSWTPAAVAFQAQVISTMLDDLPPIPIYVFIRAGEDFSFYWPQPPGLWNCETDSMLRKKKKSAPISAQISIPIEPIVFETRAKSQGPLPQEHHPICYVEDFFRYWARCLPFRGTQGNDEPIPDAAYMGNPGIYVRDSAAWTVDVNNSWMICQDYLSLYSSMFLYYKGSIGIKALAVPRVQEDAQPYVYLALNPPKANNYVTHNPFTSNPNVVPVKANLGVGSVVTPAYAQPVVEATIPMMFATSWAPVCPAIDVIASEWDGDPRSSIYEFPSVSTNLALWDHQTGDLMDSLFRKGGQDYIVRCPCLIPPPFLWMARGGDWS